MNLQTEYIPHDLISTKRAAEIFGFKDASAVRYYVKTNRIKGYKDRRGFLYISESESKEVLQPRLISVN